MLDQAIVLADPVSGRDGAQSAVAAARCSGRGRAHAWARRPDGHARQRARPRSRHAQMIDRAHQADAQLLSLLYEGSAAACIIQVLMIMISLPGLSWWKQYVCDHS